jgi:hypothetical protein
MSRGWSRSPRGESPSGSSPNPQAKGQPKAETPKPAAAKVAYPPGNFATESDLGEALGLAILAHPSDGHPMLGVMMGPGIGSPIDPEQAFKRGILLGRGWKPIHVDSNMPEQPTDPPASDPS